MQLKGLKRVSEFEWHMEPRGRMRVPGVLFGRQTLIEDMDEKVADQVASVASLPGIVSASFAMPDAHWGYGFPIGGVAAFNPETGGVVSAGGVGFDISCGVRTILTGLTREEFAKYREKIADALFHGIPAGVGRRGHIRVAGREMDEMLTRGAQWAVARGWGEPKDLDRIEHRGCVPGADPAAISAEARRRQEEEMGTLGAGNHYLEMQEVAEIYDAKTAERFGLCVGDIVVSIHCGSRGLGHQIATEYMRRMVAAAQRHGIELPERDLACAPIRSEEGRAYLGAMRAAINCALANREMLTHLVREHLRTTVGPRDMPLLYDVSHNTCREETHVVNGKQMRLFVHRKGATAAWGPGYPELPEELRDVGQPVLIGGTMGTASYILAGTAEGERKAFASACHGAGRQMSRTQATKTWRGRKVVDDLAAQGIIVRCRSDRGVAEEAPGAYKDVSEVVDSTHAAGLARKVARLKPLVCIKG
jgi:tRNA-splicing ligase RtcB